MVRATPLIPPPMREITMVEPVEGRTLETLLDAYTKTRSRMPLDLALFIGIEMAEALAGARLATSPEGVRVHVVHGELSSSDVMLSWNGEVKLTDFGIAAA